ncbi:MAG: zinc ribbon domain-containing protein [Thermoplasmata archaeon]
MLDSLLPNNLGMIIPFAVVIIGLVLVIIYLLVKQNRSKGILAPKKHKEIKVRESLRQDDFECPRCGAIVDGDTSLCHECGAEFETDNYLCPVCGTVVTKDDESCPECEEPFIVVEDEDRFECHECGARVDQFDKECERCGARFWSPVKKKKKSSINIDEEGPKKISPDLVDVVGHEDIEKETEDPEESEEDLEEEYW